MKFIPFGPRILVELFESETQFGDIILPDAHVPKPTQGRVIALGMAPKHEFVCKVGDRVLLPAYGGHGIKIDGKTWQVVMEEELIGKLED